MNSRASAHARFIWYRRDADSTNGRRRRQLAAANRRPPRGEPSPKQKTDDFAVTADAGFDAIGFQIRVVHLPSGALHRGNLAATQPRDDRVDIASRPVGKRG